MRIIDISRGLLSTPVYPGDPLPYTESVYKISDGKVCNLSSLFACLHTGTHVDAPLHFIEGGTPVEQMSLDLFIGQCLVISAEGVVDAETIAAIEKTDDAAILLFKGQIEVSVDAVAALVQKGFYTVGTEVNTIGSFDAHRVLLGQSIGIIENLDLSEVECGSYFLFAPPIKIEGADGAFCRAVLIEF